MQFKISPTLIERFPSTVIGILCCKGITNSESTDEVSRFLRTEELRIRSSFTKDTFTQDPKIAVWRKIYADFGVKPKDAKSSIENLYRLVLSDRDIRRISLLVDLYNSISLKHMLPLGGEDLATIEGDIELCFAGGAEPAVKLLGDEEAASPVPGEVIYKDSISAICRRWNWREADRTKLTNSTKDCVLVIEGIDVVSKEAVTDALSEMAELIGRFCGGSSSQHILHAANLQCSL